MTLFRTAEPAAEPLALAEAKAHLRLDHASEDALIARLIKAAREHLETTAGLALVEQGWRLALDDLPPSGLVRLRVHPLREITAVTLYGSEGEASLLTPDDYEADLKARPGRLKFRRRPERHRCLNGIEIDFVAGFGAANEVPAVLKQALLLLVAHGYELRAGFGPDKQPAAIPPGYEQLVAGFRARRL